MLPQREVACQTHASIRNEKLSSSAPTLYSSINIINSRITSREDEPSKKNVKMQNQQITSAGSLNTRCSGCNVNLRGKSKHHIFAYHFCLFLPLADSDCYSKHLTASWEGSLQRETNLLKSNTLFV